MDKRLERILPRVQKPARYTGGEYNAVMKDKSGVDTRFAFCFPDTYEAMTRGVRPGRSSARRGSPLRSSIFSIAVPLRLLLPGHL